MWTCPQCGVVLPGHWKTHYCPYGDMRRDDLRGWARLCMQCFETIPGDTQHNCRRYVSVDVPPLADDYDGMDAPACGHSLVPTRELTEWMVREGWRTSKQELVERLLKDYDVVRKA